MEFISGIFKCECKNRFRCVVNVENSNEICYVASSSHLSHFVDLEDKRVILRKNNSKTKKTQFTLYAVDYNGTKVLLELSLINRLIYNYITVPNDIVNPMGIVKFEQTLNNNYKADLVIYENNQIIVIEAKSLLTFESYATYPSIYIERMKRQFEAIEKLLFDGHEVYFWLVSLNPNCKTIRINSEDVHFYEALKKCLSLGLKLVIANIIWEKDRGFVIDEANIYKNNDEFLCFNIQSSGKLNEKNK